MTERAPVLALKTGELPAYGAFVRHVWLFLHEGDSALCAPPDMFTLPLDDDNDVRVVAREATRCLMEFAFADDRIEAISERGQVRVVFRDLEVLHTFLRLMSQRALAGDAAAHDVVSFALRMLGFRWD